MNVQTAVGRKAHSSVTPLVQTPVEKDSTKLSNTHVEAFPQKDTLHLLSHATSPPSPSLPCSTHSLMSSGSGGTTFPCLRSLDVLIRALSL